MKAGFAKQVLDVLDAGIVPPRSSFTWWHTGADGFLNAQLRQRHMGSRPEAASWKTCEDAIERVTARSPSATRLVRWVSSSTWRERCTEAYVYLVHPARRQAPQREDCLDATVRPTRHSN